MEYPDAIAGLLLALAAIESALLYAIYRRRISNKVLYVGAAVVILCSWVSPAFISLDPYTYAAYAAMGRDAYNRHAVPMSGQYRVVSDAFATDGGVPRSPYGPLWLVLSGIVTRPFPTLVEQALAFRFVGTLALFALLAACKRLGFDTRMMAILALNPAIATQYVMNGHNDLLGIAALAVGAAVLNRSKVFAVVSIAAAGLIKLPLAVVALPVFAAIKTPQIRVLCVFVTLMLVATCSMVGGGSEYVAALAVHLPYAGFTGLLAAATSIAAAATIVSALMNSRRFPSSVWLFPLAGSYPTPWYTFWGFGYAVGSRAAMEHLLIFLPIAAFVIDAMFIRIWTITLLMPALIVWLLWATFARWLGFYDRKRLQ
ncbi:MAG: hypothetical protein JO277_14030 [Candidatus Eremiobacteraeota bacterium]|nr:hypothetical protein [Candidatus Eremiobacteraeota bacterium]